MRNKQFLTIRFWPLLLLVLLTGLRLESPAAVRQVQVKAGFLVYSFDHNYLLGQGEVLLKTGAYEIRAGRIDLDLQEKSALLSGRVSISDGRGEKNYDLVEINLDSLAFRGSVFADSIHEESSFLAAEAEFQRKSQRRIDLNTLRDSLLYFLCTEVQLRGDRVYGLGVTAFLEGVQSVTLKRFRLDVLAGDKQPQERPFSIERFWYYQSQGFILNSALRLEKEWEGGSLRNRQTLGLNYDPFARSTPRHLGLDFQSDTTIRLSPKQALNIRGSLVARNQADLRLVLSRSWNEKLSQELQLELKKPWQRRGEAWLGLLTSFNDFTGWGRFNLSLKAAEKQHLVDLQYGRQMLKGLDFTFQQAFSRLRLSQTDETRLANSSVALQYNHHLFQIGADYALNRDLIRETSRSSPRLQMRLNPLSMYAGLLKLNLHSTLLSNRVLLAGRREDAWKANFGLGLATEPLPVWTGFTLNTTLALEQFLDQNPDLSQLASGVVVRGRQVFSSGAGWEIIYNFQSRRKLSDWFVSGTTSQDASLLLFLAPDKHVLNGRASISYDAKRGRFNSGFLDADLHLFKNWRLQSQLNYDFLVRRLSADFFLVKKSGRILFRVTYRTLSRQFLIELIPG